MGHPYKGCVPPVPRDTTGHVPPCPACPAFSRQPHPFFIKADMPSSDEVFRGAMKRFALCAGVVRRGNPDAIGSLAPIFERHDTRAVRNMVRCWRRLALFSDGLGECTQGDLSSLWQFLPLRSF